MWRECVACRLGVGGVWEGVGVIAISVNGLVNDQA